MKILHISDTHGQHRKLTDLPGADVLVHSGDFTMAGSDEEAIDFMNWFCDLPFSHKIFIAGNHDDCFFEANIDGLDSNCHYLCNSSIEIGGKVFYGIPLFMPDVVCGKQNKSYNSIPIGTDILITHAPPHGILDYADNIHFGSEELLKKVSEISPRLHLFGHIHNSAGKISLHDTVFSNGSIIDEHYNQKHISYNIFDI